MKKNRVKNILIDFQGVKYYFFTKFKETTSLFLSDFQFQCNLRDAQQNNSNFEEARIPNREGGFPDSHGGESHTDEVLHWHAEAGGTHWRLDKC